MQRNVKMPIVTKRGDKGESDTLNGRLRKTSRLFTAIGAVDLANAPDQYRIRNRGCYCRTRTELYIRDFAYIRNRSSIYFGLDL